MIMDAGFVGFAVFFGSRLRPNSLNQPENISHYSRNSKYFACTKLAKAAKAAKIRHSSGSTESVTWPEGNQPSSYSACASDPSDSGDSASSLVAADAPADLQNHGCRADKASRNLSGA
jgi:hypothetical protein